MRTNLISNWWLISSSVSTPRECPSSVLGTWATCVTFWRTNLTVRTSSLSQLSRSLSVQFLSSTNREMDVALTVMYWLEKPKYIQPVPILNEWSKSWYVFFHLLLWTVQFLFNLDPVLPLRTTSCEMADIKKQSKTKQTKNPQHGC